ncbi:MAG: CDP-alcohol phosphatidyltransferase family protein [Flavisolibacter sp.]
MPIFRNIPNFFTLLNLVFGCIAIVLILQTNESIAPLDQSGIAVNQFLPEKMYLGVFFIFAAAVVDFLDGFLARLFKATSRMGEQLDSLSDMVSFGVAPSIILYQLLRMGFAREEQGLDVSVWALLPAFLFACAVAWRLAKFNISTDQSYGFRGVPSPAGGLLVASFPLIIWYEYFQLQALFSTPWFLYIVILLVSYLMISDIRFMALKFKDYRIGNNLVKYLFLVLAIVSIILLEWFAVPVIFILYILFSFFDKEKIPVKEMVDVTV